MRNFLALMILTAATVSAEPLWPRADLQSWVDYRQPAPLAENASLSPAFRDVPFPQGVLFSTTTGSIYWYDAVADTVVCLLPLNGVVDGLSMTVDRSLYSFSWNGQPYLWRPATQPGTTLVQLDVGKPDPRNYYEVTLNATGTAALLTRWWSDDYEGGRTRTLIDLKTMTKLRYQNEARWEFTPDGAALVEEGYDYDNRDAGDNPTRYSEISTFAGVSLKRFPQELQRGEGRLDAHSRWDGSAKEVPAWYQGQPVEPIGSWDGLGLPPGPEYVPESDAHPAGEADGLEIVTGSDVLVLTRRSPSGVLWVRKMRTYGEAAGVWLDGEGKTLLVLSTKPGSGQRYNGFPEPRVVLRQYDWRTGERTAADIALTEGDAGSILEWVPGRFVAVSVAQGRLEYSFTTRKVVLGNGTTPIRGRAITGFFPSMTGSLSYDKTDRVFTFPRFPGQVGGITDFVVREDQKLVATRDEAGQVALRRVDDGEVLGVTRFQDGELDPAPLAGLTEEDFKAVFAAPAASSQYRTTKAVLLAGPGFRQ